MFLYFGNKQILILDICDMLTHFVAHAAQGRIIDRIGALLAGGRETQFDTTIGDLDNNAKT